MVTLVGVSGPECYNPRPCLCPSSSSPGPTGSGKSALALAVAEAFGGTIINADSMQVYRDLAVLTARPGPAVLARAPHRLYGIVDAAEAYSVGRWREAALAEIAAARAPAGCRCWSAAPGSICARCSTASPRCRRSAAAATRPARSMPRLGPPHFHAALARLDPEPPRACARRHPTPDPRL